MKEKLQTWKLRGRVGIVMHCISEQMCFSLFEISLEACGGSVTYCSLGWSDSNAPFDNPPHLDPEKTSLKPG